MTLLLGAYVVFTFWFLIPGRADASTIALVVLVLFTLMYLIYRKVKAVDSRWGKGARAEQMVGGELDKLHRDGFHIFHDYCSGSKGNVDHFIVGSPGVFVIETKSCTGEIASNGKELFRDGKRLTFDPVSQVKGEAAEIHELLRDTCGVNRWVQPILCYSDADVRCHDLVRGVEVVKCGALGRVIMSYTKRREWLSESEIRAISKMLQRKIGAAPSASPDSPPPTQGWLRKNISPDRVFFAGFLVFLLMVSVVFAENTARMLNDMADLYQALGFAKSSLL